jgi:EAL domain-containing protein (putative c-di-GMP-specific phosphodiesterase class I)
VHAEILNGIRAGEFHVVYQPQMTADGARMAAVEALVRWNHPARGALGPADFIAIAEKNCAINELGAFVLRQACLDALGWPGLTVSVNVSAVQLHAAAFAESVEGVVRETGLPFGQLELEIVETALIENFDLAASAISRLRSLGIKIALDDFVETEEQRRFLRACGCHYLQGYLFSRPVPAGEIARMLAFPQGERRTG